MLKQYTKGEKQEQVNKIKMNMQNKRKNQKKNIGYTLQQITPYLEVAPQYP